MPKVKKTQDRLITRRDVFIELEEGESLDLVVMGNPGEEKERHSHPEKPHTPQGRIRTYKIVEIEKPSADQILPSLWEDLDLCLAPVLKPKPTQDDINDTKEAIGQLYNRMLAVFASGVQHGA